MKEVIVRKGYRVWYLGESFYDGDAPNKKNGVVKSVTRGSVTLYEHPRNLVLRVDDILRSQNTKTTKAYKKAIEVIRGTFLYDGFIKVTTDQVEDETSYGSYYNDGMPVVKFIKGDDICIVVAFHDNKGKLDWTGHTHFNTPKGWRTFDRVGIDDSFYSDSWSDKEVILQNQLHEELVKIVNRRKVLDTMVEVPDIGYSITPETKKKYAKILQDGGSVDFTPGGFGTGTTLTGRAVMRTSRFNPEKKASKKLMKFFNVPVLYILTFDYD